MDKTVFTFGRLNPPTVGHEKLVDKVKQVAKRLNAEPHVFLSHSQNSKKDPLNYNQKFKYAKQAFGNLVTKSNARTVIQIMQELEKMNHKDVVMVVGSDRVQEFRALLNKYNGKDYNFNSIKVVSAGERDPDAEGVSGMSASKMRAAVSAGDQASFMQGVPSKLSRQSAARMYSDLRSAMNITEDFNDFDWELWAETVDIDDEEILDEAVLSFAQRIKRARTMKRLAPRMKNLRRIKKFRMADKDILMKRARKQAIKMFRKKVAGEKGEHYSQLSPAAKISIDKLIQKKMPAVSKLAQRLLPKVRKAEVERLRSARKPTNEQLEEVAQDPDIKDRTGTQPKKYFKDLSKSTKAARDAHFKKYAKKDDSDPSNYKPAPGDKSAETKPSVHTKNYKKMFGESNGQTDDVADIVPDRIRISMISSSKKRLLNDKFEKMTEQDIAARVSGPSTTQTAKRHSDERQRLKDKQARERETLKNRQAGQKDRAQIRDIRKESLDEMFEAMQRRQQKASSSIAPGNDYALEEKAIDALKKKAEKSGISYGTLKKVYDRGMAAWKSGHRPGTTPQQWAFARVNSFVTKSKGTWGGADKDLASKVRKESLDESFQMTVQQPAGYGQIVTAKEAGIEIQAGFALHPSVTEEGGAGEYGTDKLKKKYRKDTPGEEQEEKNDDEI